ncbi:EEP domain-containing protein [candidate division KSB3 bacterium]|uniref:EEP domain-containing protein n=1 Tax=candidate division KSB3 bacterium TaxID=2044937 RepID=A0A9D5K0P9_9BACT|nr:EEP domain-containing protein [candidate division KSB3 bacterium]MBD3327202.1 EEP domain-containing protein [candidate division KSB3 bacterium]
MIRVMTYNVHRCLGLDGRVSPNRIAEIIARYAPDVVALQELDVHRDRTGNVHQAERIARLLEMRYHFHPSFIIEAEQYGNAVFSHFPLRKVKAGQLPGRAKLEPRSALWVEIACQTPPLHLINTHLGLRPRERLEQVQRLLGTNWLDHPDCRVPLVLCGDFNARPRSKVYRHVTLRLHDVVQASAAPIFARTWMGLLRLDYIFISPDIQVNHVFVPRTTLTRRASDHLPVVTDLVVNNPC